MAIEIVTRKDPSGNQVRHYLLLHSPTYNLDRELEMVWLNRDKAVAVRCMLWLNWFCASERSLENINPPSDLGRLVAVEVSTVWMHNVCLTDNTANFCVDFDHYCNTGTQTALETIAASDDGGQRACDMLDDHNNNQSKRSLNDGVRKGMFENMREYFKGSESRFAQGAGQRTKHHQEFMHTAASLCVTHEFLKARGVRCTASEIMGITVPMLNMNSQEPTCA